MTAARRKKPRLERSAALSARPHRAPAVSTEPRPDGGVIVTVEVPRRGLARLLGGAGTVRRSFGLDALGREVLEACDGRRSVQSIVRRFAAAHALSQAEAEMSVAAFLKTLLTKGLVVMEVDRPGKAR